MPWVLTSLDVIGAFLAIGISLMTFAFCMLTIKTQQAIAKGELDTIKAEMEIIETLDITAKMANKNRDANNLH